jgi:hypothetical protein
MLTNTSFEIIKRIYKSPILTGKNNIQKKKHIRKNNINAEKWKKDKSNAKKNDCWKSNNRFK